MVDTKDILYKAAEDVQQGMWCKGQWFSEHLGEGEWTEENDGNPYRVFAHLATDQMASSQRCAEGSLVLATRLLGGDGDDYELAAQAALTRAKADGLTEGTYLFDLNDDLPDDPFEAGAQLAELFRTTADAL